MELTKQQQHQRQQTQPQLQAQAQLSQTQQLYHDYQQQRPSAPYALSSDDYNQIMMAATIGSVLPSRNSIVGFMNNPDGLLAIGNTSGIFDTTVHRAEQTNNHNHSSSDFKNNNFAQQNAFQNSYQNAAFQQQQQQLQQLNLSQAKAQLQLRQLDNLNNFNEVKQHVIQMGSLQIQNSRFQQQRGTNSESLNNFNQQYKQVNQMGSLQNNGVQQQRGTNTDTNSLIGEPNAAPEYGRITGTGVTTGSPGSDLPEISPSCAGNEITRSVSSMSVSKVDPFTFNLPDSFAAAVDDDIFADLQPIPFKSNKRRMQPSKTVTPIPTTSTAATVATVPDDSVANPTPAPSLLHQACYLYPTTLAVVNSALAVEKSNARRRVPTPTPTPTPAELNNPSKRQKRLEAFSLPLHIAIDRDASPDVLRVLVDVASDVIAMTDGPDVANAVSVLLQKKCRTLDVVSMLVKANPEAVKVVDRHYNTSLHVACAQGASLDIVKLIYATYPEAMSKKNFHGQSPLDVAQRTNACPLDVTDYIQQVVSDSLECKASHLVDLEDEDFP